MQNRLVITFLLLSLCSCASQPSNFAKLSEAYNTQLAKDAAHQLAAFYPPASTHVAMSQGADDAFGVALQKDLRETGYAVQISGRDWFLSSSSAHNVSRKVDTQTMSAQPLPLSYIVDAIGDNLYRVTIKSGGHVMSRVYSISGDHIARMGAWARSASAQEDDHGTAQR